VGEYCLSINVLVDTDILIDVGRNMSEAIRYIQQLEDQTTILVSAVVQMELIIGCQTKSELQKVEKFLKRYEIIRLNEAISEIAVELLRQYRLSHGLLIADAIIAATAIHLSEPLASKNQRDYRFIEGLDYYLIQS
jgi:predicted nucleic acid-binding protein